MLDQKMIDKLIETAVDMTKKSYAPYSDFKVGAALLAKNGQIFTGCNIENAAYTPTNCAERTAFFKAVSEGEREFEAIAVAGGERGEISGIFPPCGVCRQVMLEFCDPDFKIYMGTADGYETAVLADLIPYGFTSGQHMQKK